MAVADQNKISDRKIMQNEAQYDLDRKAAKISALSSNNLDRYEYLTSVDLDLNPSTVEEARFEYSPSGISKKTFNKGLKEEDRKEGLLKRLKNIDDKNEEQLKAIEDQKEVQTKIISKNKIKPPLLKSIYSQEVKNGRINNNEAKIIFKTLEDMEGSKIDYYKLVFRSAEYFDFTRFELISSFYLKLMNGSIGINVSKLKEFKNEIHSLKRKKAKKQSDKTNKNYILENAEALYNGLNIIVDAFENRIFESKYRPEIDVDDYLIDDPESNLNSASDYGYYGLTDKKLQMFKKLFGYQNPELLRQTLIEATDENIITF